MSGAENNPPATLTMRVPFATFFEDDAQLLKLSTLTILSVRLGVVRVSATTFGGGEISVSHSDGPVVMSLGLMSGSNLEVSDGYRRIHIQFPGWKFKSTARAIRDAGFDLDAVGLFGRPVRFDSK